MWKHLYLFFHFTPYNFTLCAHKKFLCMLKRTFGNAPLSILASSFLAVPFLPVE
jgi:hypothetical protein